MSNSAGARRLSGVHPEFRPPGGIDEYLCLIYFDPATWAARPAAEAEAMTREYADYTRSIKASGHSVAAPPGVRRRGDHRPDPGRQAVDYRWPLRGDQGAAWRILPDRSDRPQRSHSGRRPDPVRPGRLDRGAPPVAPNPAWSAGAGHGRATERPPEHRRGGLSLRVAPRPCDPHPPPRRLRSRRGGAARRVRGGDGAVAARRRSRPTRVRGSSRPGASRPSTRCAAARGSTGRSERSRSDSRRPAATCRDSARIDGGRSRRRPAAPRSSPAAIPALALDAQVALTLREVCGFTTEEIAHAFLTRRADASPSASSAPRPRSATRAFPTQVPVARRAARPARRACST